MRLAVIGLCLSLALAGNVSAQSSASPVKMDQVLAAALKNPELAPRRTEIEEALKCLEAFMKAFNARDVKAYDATFNFPSVRLASGNLRLIQAGEQTPAMFETGALADWDHSAWQKIEVIHAGPDKVHFSTRFARYRKDGSLIGGFDSFYVVTREKDHWGVKIRSSFAP